MLTISPSPHFKDNSSVRKLMLGVLIALCPSFVLSIYFFGIGAFATTLTSVLCCVFFEWLITHFLFHQKSHLGDLSAVLTGVLLAFNLPSNISPFIVLTGALIAIGVGKMTFGGLGCNIFNPALVGRVFLLISFPQQMTTWPTPIEARASYLDAVTGATPLAMIKSGHLENLPSISDMLFGSIGGSLGEVAALCLILGGIYMIVKKIITWHIPVSIIATVAVFSTIVWLTDTSSFANPLYHIFGGGLLLGAFFMATDYVSSPMSSNGKLIFGFGIGVLTVIIRIWGSYPEGMSFAILIMNALVPLIDKQFKPKRFGKTK